MTTQRYVVVVSHPDTKATRAFGPMSNAAALKFRDGLRKRYPELYVSCRPAWRPTYKGAAVVIDGLLR